LGVSQYVGRGLWEGMKVSFIVQLLKNFKHELLVIQLTMLRCAAFYIWFIKTQFMKSKFFFVAFLLSIISISSFGQDASALRKKQFNLDDEVGIEGYDPVAYFKLGKAVKGNKDITTYYQGVTYRFSSTESREEFKKNPSAYEPQYGGWCAYAMGAKGEKVSIDPKTFKILNGKLYLFYHSYWNNTLTDWNKDESSLKTKADAAWQKIFR